MCDCQRQTIVREVINYWREKSRGEKKRPYDGDRKTEKNKILRRIRKS